MQVGQGVVFELTRNGIRYRVFSSRQAAIQYLAAALDLDPKSTWELNEVFMSRV